MQYRKIQKIFLKKNLKKWWKKKQQLNIFNSDSYPTVCGYAGKDTAEPIGNRDETLRKVKEKGVKYDFLDFSNFDHYLEEDS